MQISELLDVQLHLGWLLALTTRHDKEGYCKVSAQDVPFIAHCAHEYTLVFTKVGNLVFLAFYMQSADEPSRTSIVDVYAQLKLFSEIIHEASTPNQPPSAESYALDVRENVTALSLVCDLLFDHGVPHIQSKSTLLSLMERADLLSKASGLIGGEAQAMNTSHGRVCSQLSGIVQQLPTNPNAFWR